MAGAQIDHRLCINHLLTSEEIAGAFVHESIYPDFGKALRFSCRPCLVEVVLPFLILIEAPTRISNSTVSILELLFQRGLGAGEGAAPCS